MQDPISTEPEETIEDRVNRIVREVFPRCKNELGKATTELGAQHPDVWLRYRNAMDRLLKVQEALLNRRKIDFKEVLDAVEYIFNDVAVEAWVITSGFYIGRLNDQLNSWRYTGNRSVAMKRLYSAIRLKQRCRLIRSESFQVALVSARGAALQARKGLEELHLIPIFERFSAFLTFLDIAVLLVVLLFTLRGFLK